MINRQIWEQWPKCPGCGRRRQTVCPACGQAGNQVPLAEYQATEALRFNTRRALSQESGEAESRSVLLLCSRCDEAFAPQFYRVCPACGRDAGEGIEPEMAQRRSINSRVLFVLYTLLAIALLVVFYFWWLFQ
jgi:hypothetical protein